jgi:hypothetical protein
MHTIFLQIRDAIQSVQITEILNPVQSMVFIEFENGYGNIFFMDCESGRWVEQDLGFTRLAEIIGNELKYIIKPGAAEDREIKWIKKSINLELFHFGYSKFISGEEQRYEIFASNKRYMFSLIKKGEDTWKIFKIQGTEDWKFSTRYARIVPFLLETFNL